MADDLIERWCDLCGSEENVPVTSENGFPIVRCTACRFVYVSRIPRVANGKVLGEYYLGTADEIELGRRRYTQVSEFVLDEIEKTIRRGSILDVGCGYGFFLKAAEGRGWKVFGTELSDIATKYANDRQQLKHVVCSELDPSLFEGQQFDVINLTNVLEHVPSPTRTLDVCREMLRDGGVLTVRVPNIHFYEMHRRVSSVFALLGIGNISSWGYLATPPPEHLSGFTPTTIERLLDKCAFERIRIKPSKLSGFVNDRWMFRCYETVSGGLSAISAGRLIFSPTLFALAKKT